MGLLVLSRHRDEVIRIGDDIKVMVVDIRGDKVRLGVDAPSNVPVHRDEVYRAILRHQPRTCMSDAEKLARIRGLVQHWTMTGDVADQIRAILSGVQAAEGAT